LHILIHKGKGGGEVLNQREGERGNRGKYSSQSWVENTNMTECTPKNCECVELEKMPLIIFWSIVLGMTIAALSSA
jgi:hypothetical protein